MISKENLNDLGFQRRVSDKSCFYKPGWNCYVVEVEPGDVYLKVGLMKDDPNDKYGREEWVYFYGIDEIESYLERMAPVNPSDIEHLQQSYLAAPKPNHYNDELYHAPDNGYLS